jgi:hypothetical protein
MCVNELASELNYDFHIANYISLSVIVGMLLISILLSIYIKTKKPKKTIHNS